MFSILKFLLFSKFSFIKTIYINLKMLPLNQGLKLPIYVYKGFKFEKLDGNIIIDAPIKRGMINIGINIANYVTATNGSIRLFPNSNLIFKGFSRISQGCQILIQKEALLEVHSRVNLGDSSKIICYKKIILGEMSELTWESQITDYNSHYILNLETNKIDDIIESVVIGKRCWIGNRTTILPGTILPDNTIVASNSLLNKDYIKLGIKPFSLIGGMPARLIREGNVKRIYSYKNEQVLKDFFKINNGYKAHFDLLVDGEQYE